MPSTQILTRISDFGGISNLGWNKHSANSILSEYTEVGKTVGRAGRGQGCIVGEMWKQQHMDQWVAGENYRCAFTCIKKETESMRRQEGERMRKETTLQVEGKTFRSTEKRTYTENEAQINTHPPGLWGWVQWGLVVGSGGSHCTSNHSAVDVWLCPPRPLTVSLFLAFTGHNVHPSFLASRVFGGLC